MVYIFVTLFVLGVIGAAVTRILLFEFLITFVVIMYIAVGVEAGRGIPESVFWAFCYAAIVQVGYVVSLLFAYGLSNRILAIKITGLSGKWKAGTFLRPRHRPLGSDRSDR